jgi:HD superfamily phosphohydrolase
MHTVAAAPGLEGKGPRLGVSEGGWHAAEALVLARYFMFTQVYFHKTRVAFDHHLRRALAEMLPGGKFPKPEGPDLDEFLRWDDWRVLGLLAEGKGGEHGRRLAERDHFREVFHTPETPTTDDLAKLDLVREALGPLIQAEESAGKSWYKVGTADITVVSDSETPKVRPLSAFSPIIANLKPTGKVMLYARREDAEAVRAKVRDVLRSLP